jgi:8-oxo-dGTP pyrophosphatase MutT (NUDIX family)
MIEYKTGDILADGARRVDAIPHAPRRAASRARSSVPSHSRVRGMAERYYRCAGGVVIDEASRVLLIQRDIVRGERMLHEVRLPKGRVEPGETDAEAATREVAEETGYHGTAILADLGISENRFEPLGGDAVRRDEHYFLMRVSSEERAIAAPQSAEEALYTNVWTDLAEAERRLTYASERMFLARARAALPSGDRPG